MRKLLEIKFARKTLCKQIQLRGPCEDLLLKRWICANSESGQSHESRAQQVWDTSKVQQQT